MAHTSFQYGHENSWTLGTCSNASPHESHSEAEDECCLPPGEYTLKCKDSYGDGWHGGYVTIQCNNYCEGFSKGGEESHDVTISSETDNSACGNILHFHSYTS